MDKHTKRKPSIKERLKCRKKNDMKKFLFVVKLVEALFDSQAQVCVRFHNIWNNFLIGTTLSQNKQGKTAEIYDENICQRKIFKLNVFLINYRIFEVVLIKKLLGKHKNLQIMRTFYNKLLHFWEWNIWKNEENLLFVILLH